MTPSNAYKNILSLLSEDLKKVKMEYAPLVNSMSSLFKNQIGSALLKSGKKIRTSLMLLFAKTTFSKDPSMFFYGAMIELIHLASLIHDDIIDNAAKRRGLDCFHKTWGDRSAVLLGDYIYISVLRNIIHYPGKKFEHIIADATFKLIHGEIYQSSQKGKLKIKEKEYIDFIKCKTGALFSAACQIGTALGTRNKSLIKASGDIGNNIGIAFQITDDILDIMPWQNSILGNDNMKDSSNGIATLPFIHFLRSCSKNDLYLFNKMLKKNERNGTGLYKLLEKNGSIDYAFKKANFYLKLAKNKLKIFPQNKYSRHIISLCDFILERRS